MACRVYIVLYFALAAFDDTQNGVFYSWIACILTVCMWCSVETGIVAMIQNCTLITSCNLT